MRMECLERRLAELFGGWARVVVRYPAPFILIPLLLTAVLFLGLVKNPTIIKDDLSLYTPSDAPALRDLNQLKKIYPINDTDPFYFDRRHDLKRMGYVLIVTYPTGANVLNPLILKAAAEVWEKMTSMRIQESNGDSYSYFDLCIRIPARNEREKRQCIQNPIIAAFNKDPDLLIGLKYPTSDHGWYLPYFLGGIEYNKTKHVTRARALLLPYQLHHHTMEEDRLAEGWETALAKLLSVNYHNPLITANLWTSETLPAEAARDRQTLLQLLVPLFAVVTGFTIACCLMGNMVQSRPWTGLGGVVSAALAIVSSIGCLLLAGHKFTSVAYCMPFIVFSIGVDNVFILLGAWRKSSGWKDLEDRMAETWMDAGVSITVTSLTDGLSFAVGVMTTFPSVRIFCMYASTAIFFVYLYQLTFFAGIMAITSRREVDGKNCITFQKMKLKNKQVPKWKAPSSRSFGRSLGSSDPWGAANRDYSSKETNHAVARFFRGPYATFLMQPFVRLAIILGFFVYLGFALWGCAGIKVGLEPIDLLPGDSYGRRTLTLYEDYFLENGGYLHVWIGNLTSMDYNQRVWLWLSHEIELYEHTEFSDYADSWLRVFLAFVRAAGLLLTPDNFVYILRNVFLKTPQYEKYGRDLVFDPSGHMLDTVRFPVHLRYVGMANQSRAMTFFRRLASKSDLSVSVYADFFQFAEQYDAVLPGTLVNVGAAGAAVVLVSLLLIPQPMAALWVSLTIVSINVGILGYMSFWDVRLDFVSMVTIVMSIGFCVDFSAHLAYHFAKETNGGASSRLRSALYAVGTPILQSALSTLIGVSFLMAVDSYVYRSFLKTIVLVILLGTFHGLVVLPVLLTLFHCSSSNRGPSNNPSYASNNSASDSTTNPASADEQQHESGRSSASSSGRNHHSSKKQQHNRGPLRLHHGPPPQQPPPFIMSTDMNLSSAHHQPIPRLLYPGHPAPQLQQPVEWSTGKSAGAKSNKSSSRTFNKQLSSVYPLPPLNPPPPLPPGHPSAGAGLRL